MWAHNIVIHHNLGRGNIGASPQNMLRPAVNALHAAKSASFHACDMRVHLLNLLTRTLNRDGLLLKTNSSSTNNYSDRHLSSKLWASQWIRQAFSEGTGLNSEGSPRQKFVSVQCSALCDDLTTCCCREGLQTDGVADKECCFWGNSSP